MIKSGEIVFDDRWTVLCGDQCCDHVSGDQAQCPPYQRFIGHQPCNSHFFFYLLSALLCSTQVSYTSNQGCFLLNSDVLSSPCFYLTQPRLLHCAVFAEFFTGTLWVVVTWHPVPHDTRAVSTGHHWHQPVNTTILSHASTVWLTTLVLTFQTNVSWNQMHLQENYFFW